MKKLNQSIIIALLLLIGSTGFTSAISLLDNNLLGVSTQTTSGEYDLQWIMEYGSSPWTDARYQGPQPIGDCDNDGKNELLISGRDASIRVMEWSESEQIYEETNVLHSPFYKIFMFLNRYNDSVNPPDAGGMAIGDLTGDGENEIAATWYSTIYKYIGGKYRIIGFNPYIFWNGGGSADCYIGDCDNDGQNEMILSGGSTWHGNQEMAEIVVFKWNGWRLVKYAEYNDPSVSGYVYMSGLGDVDYDGENEIVCAYSNRVMVLNWDAQNSMFVPTNIYQQYGQDFTFGVVCKDCDNDGKAEILLSYYSPRVTIFKWDGADYQIQFDKTWPNGEPVIEGIDVGDTDDDGLNEVAVGAGQTYILQWNGTTYVEEAVLPTFGWMAVVCIGDCDNDGKNEINAGNVDVEPGQKFTEWVFKYEWKT
ncbi:MAG: hypothetical protein BV457_03135 [Thermoplasmata archaeon M9B1D]|nr:MAG: hypothetical protein BV457_03135 [Thermoplasmata archaeon M9B1D]PNX50944.1 MAG: hypothetical protein BV456_04975 [Thermoplasmata archaeon M8B2D]